MDSSKFIFKVVANPVSVTFHTKVNDEMSSYIYFCINFAVYVCKKSSVYPETILRRESQNRFSGYMHFANLMFLMRSSEVKQLNIF